MTKTLRSIPYALVISLGFTSPDVALADGVVKSGFIFQLDNSVFQAPEYSLSSVLAGTQALSLPDMTLTQGQYPVQVSGIQGSVNYQMKSSSDFITVGGSEQISSQSVSAQLTIGQISVNTVVQTVIGPVTVNSTIQGSCTNIPLTLASGQAQASGTLTTGIDTTGLPSLSMTNFQIAWPATAWQIGAFTCTGIEGLEAQVSLALANYLKDSSAVAPQMSQMLNTRLASYQGQLRLKFLAPRPVPITASGLSVMLYPSSLAPVPGSTTGQFEILGTIQFTFASPTFNGVTNVGSPTQAPVVAKSDSDFMLLLPADLISALNQSAFQSGFYNVRKNGTDLPAFENLRSSFFDSFFVWPEIQNVPKQTTFVFDFSTPKLPVLSTLRDMGDGTLAGNINGEIDVMSWIAPAKTYEKFTSFKAPSSGKFVLSFSSDNQGPFLNVLFSTMNMNLSAAWDPSYAKQVSNNYVNTGLIANSVTGSMTSSGLQMRFGTLDLTSVLTLSPSALHNSPGWLQIEWK